eukprot:TRINITY_DN31066_c0_g1_i1.p1 TRINITY_DN31066_c0_g1~~TRINITY_DN31066_c0_g1_i1.p1  ORF type:complete len:427 (-),score=113.76 TRINITY_DN31066_c0_g1_i1:30-1310(-)
MEEETKAFFRQQQEDPDNQFCIDDGEANPQWASVNHGCYISLEASGVHRGLGVHISFVRSVLMDAWKPSQLRMMELGGNRKLKVFFKEQGVPEAMPIALKYKTRAAEWYRKHLRALVDGTELPEPLEPGTGHLPMEEAPSASTRVPSASPIFGPGSVGKAGYAGAAQGVSGSGTSASSTSSGKRAGARDDGLSNLLGGDIGSKIGSGLWGAVGSVKKMANKSKSFVDSKVAQAQDEGLLDALVDTAKQSASAVSHSVGKGVEAAQRDMEATKTLMTDADALQNKTSEAFNNVAKSIGTSADWISGQITGGLNVVAGGGRDSSAALQGMSSGQMQGFGSDSLPSTPAPDRATVPTSSTSAPATSSTASTVGLPTGTGMQLPAEARTAFPAPAVPSKVQSPPAAPPPQLSEAVAKAASWDADGWGDWK